MGRRYLRRIRDNRADKSRACLGGSARARPFMDSLGYVNVRASHEGCAVIGRAQEVAFGVQRSGLVIAGFEVPHTHLHVIPLRQESDVLLSNAAPASDTELDEAMDKLRQELISAGYGAQVPASMKALN